MKIIKINSLTILLLFLCLTCKAQILYNNDINKFVGTWRWTSNTDTFEITLQKQIHQDLELITGWHKFVKNGQIVQSSYEYIGRNTNLDHDRVDNIFNNTVGGFTYPSKPTLLIFTVFFDILKGQNYEGYLYLLPNSLTQANIKITNPIGFKPRASQFPFGSTAPPLPRDLILTKL